MAISDSEIPSEPSYACNCGVKSQDDKLCDVCRQVDFREILCYNNLSSLKSARPIFNLRHIAGSSCPLCTFLKECCPEDELEDGDRLSKYWLMVRQTSPIFGTKGLVDGPFLQINKKYRYILPGIDYGCRLILPIHDGPSLSGKHMKPDEINISLVQQWLGICNELHAPCRNHVDNLIDGLVPEMHVIDCFSKTIVPYTSASDGYVALSYVWGSDSLGRTDFQGGMLKSLPKLVEDTVMLVQRLGMRFLWVDRYCIPQNDASARDLQIQNMGRIYGDSRLTIIAAAGRGPEYGLPGVSSVLRKPQPEVRVGGHCLAGFISPRKEVSRSTWNSRGWTYQEGILSKRRLVFTESQMSFQCLGLNCTESISVPLRTLHSPSGTFFDSVDLGKSFPTAMELRDTSTVLSQINQYCCRYLSFDGDALDAIAGVFKTYWGTKQPVKFLCGLPIFAKDSLRNKSYTSILVQALSWLACDSLIRRPAFPSWTWVGWKNSSGQGGRVAYPDYAFEFRSSNTRRYAGEKLYPVEIKAEFKDGQILEWESSHRQILDISASGNHPSHLRISGWGFRAQISWDRIRGWRFVTPPACVQTADTYSIQLPTLGLCEEDTATLDILAVLIATSMISYMELLIFRKIKGGDSCERIGHDRRPLAGGGPCEFLVSEEGTNSASFGNLQLEWTEIRVA